ncbi:CPBP family intramembrane metalloprotease [bacterium]|nr:MAG: CPBP family intramembrane metalloprotease [bacterium]
MVLTPLPLVITANAAVGRRWAFHATGILAGLSAGVTFLFGALDLAGAGAPGGRSPLAVDLGIMVTAVAAAALASKPVRERVARILPIDPDSPVHALALVLAVILFGTQLTSIAFTDVLASDRSIPPLTLADLISQETPFLILAAAGVGIYIRRNSLQAATRLGLVAPRWWQLALALAAAGAFFAFAQGMSGLSHAWTPAVARQVDVTTQHLFGGLGTPVGIAALAIAPGLCEEILFRGALQPRLGLLATAVLFTSIHTQYGLSLDTLSVFVIALGLGAIRKSTNTTTSCVCHITYNLVVGLGIADSLIGLAAAVELALVAVAAYAIWSARRRAAMPANP